MSWLMRLFLFIVSLFSAYQLGQEMATKPQIRKPEPAVVYQQPPPSLPPQPAEYEPEPVRPRQEKYRPEPPPARTREAAYQEQVNRIKKELEDRRERVSQPVRIIVEVQPPRRVYQPPVYYIPAPRYVPQPPPNRYFIRYIHH